MFAFKSSISYCIICFSENVCVRAGPFHISCVEFHDLPGPFDWETSARLCSAGVSWADSNPKNLDLITASKAIISKLSLLHNLSTRGPFFLNHQAFCNSLDEFDHCIGIFVYLAS